MSVYPVYAREPNIRGDNRSPHRRASRTLAAPMLGVMTFVHVPASLRSCHRCPPAVLLSLSVMTERHVERHVHANKRHVSVMPYHKTTTRPDATHGPARSTIGAKTSLDRGRVSTEDESRLNRTHPFRRPTRAAVRRALRLAAHSCARALAVWAAASCGLRLAEWAAASCVGCG
jgi:hypothetical protein